MICQASQAAFAKAGTNEDLLDVDKREVPSNAAEGRLGQVTIGNVEFLGIFMQMYCAFQ